MSEFAAYDPLRRRVTTQPRSSLYEKFHELSHMYQHQERPFWFALMRAGRRIPGVEYFATLWLEWDARNRTRRQMRQLQLWDYAAQQEAARKLRTYIWR